MSGFHLVPEAGGEPVHLPPGETVLGRGPLLGVTDKRVSRNHGLLENLNGQLRLKPTHVNPCFFQSSPGETPQPLQRDSWHLLRHGDLFSLLPGQLVFRVAAEGGDENGDGDGNVTPRNSQMFEEEEPDLRSPPPPPAPASPLAGSGCQQTSPQTEEVVSSVAEVKTVRRLASPPVAPPTVPPAALLRTPLAPRRKRVLPAWMLAASAGSFSSGPKVPSSVQRSKKPAATSKRATAKRAVPEREEEEEEEEPGSMAMEGGEEEEEEKVQMPKKRRKRTQDEDEEEAARPKRKVVSAEPPPPPTELSSESEGFTMEVDEEEREVESRSSPPVIGAASRRQEVSRAETARGIKSRSASGAAEAAGSAPSSGSAPTSSSAPSKPGSRRTPCPYGKDCYRKNPLHFQECSHPGDTDYEEEEEPEEEGEESERPECPYGTDCYRKNPLHRKEYKHTKKPAYNTRNLPKKNQDQDSDLDSDQSGYDNSFIDDGDSEDLGNDSDYVPLNSDDSGKEDTRMLQKEAKAFLRRGK